jgi:aspartyl-tRNA(Asn)/glutamyl-tRNA(Gln) amidotransferase subunit A
VKTRLKILAEDSAMDDAIADWVEAVRHLPVADAPFVRAPLLTTETQASESGVGGLRLGASGSPGEAVRRALATIEMTDPTVHAFITVVSVDAQARSARLDARAQAGARKAEPDPPLLGVPFAVKDCFTTRGVRTTCGSALFQRWVPESSAAAVERLQAAGAIMVGKTNMHELGCAVATAYPRTNNPRDPVRTAGGSSGGSAPAAAYGAVPLALGTDAGGSVRIPAAFCGVVGFKPSFASVSTDGVVGLSPTLDHVAVVAARVEDTINAMAVLSETFRACNRPHHTPRLALLVDESRTTTEPVAEAIRAALSSLERSGATLVERTVPAMRAWLAPYMLTFLSEAHTTALRWLDRIHLVGAEARATLLAGREIPAWAYVRAQQYRTSLLAEVDAALQGVDALVTPAVDHVSPIADPQPEDEAYWGELRWTAPFNLTGQPAISLPIPSRTLPVGLQLVGRYGADASLLAVARWIEAAVWSEEGPPNRAHRADVAA